MSKGEWEMNLNKIAAIGAVAAVAPWIGRTIRSNSVKRRWELSMDDKEAATIREWRKGL